MIKNIIVILFIISTLPVAALAATDDFIIKALVGGDTTPPTTPTMLSVVPVAITQIDVTWSASTDDFSLGGYVLFRDGLQQATTTLTTFSDTGLTPETLYSYEVYAFDTALNISTTSNSLSTTTLALPVVVIAPTSTPAIDVSGSESSTRLIRLHDINITTTRDAAIVNWQVNHPVRYSLRWGRTDSYNDGYIINDTYQVISTTTITDLEPATVYLYELLGIMPTGRSIVLQRGQFKTSEIANIIPPANVQRLEAVVEDNDVRLSWQLLSTESVASVRVVRNHLGFPSGLYDGAVVYNGLDTSIIDSGALKNNSPQYYTVFVIDKDGNVSSGAVVRVERDVVKTDPIISNGEIPISETVTTPTKDPIPVATSTKSLTPIENKELSLFGFDTNNIKLQQEEKVFTFIDENIFLSQDKAFVISIPYDSLPKHLKSIVVTLLDPTDHKRSYSFLLRINKDRTAYEATIAPLNVIGISRLQIEIFDFDRQVVGLYRKQIDFKASENLSGEVIFPDKIISLMSDILQTMTSGWVLFLLLPLLLIFLWWKRKTEDNP